KQSWDDSVKALAATPSVLSMMSSKLDWTQKLGDAVLAQQPDVMDAIQRLRTKAQANNKLQSNKQQKVTVTQQEGRQVVSSRPTPTRSTCRTTPVAWSTAPGRIPTISRTTSVRPAISRPVSSPPASHSAPATRSAAGATASGAAA